MLCRALACSPRAPAAPCYILIMPCCCEFPWAAAAAMTALVLHTVPSLVTPTPQQKGKLCLIRRGNSLVVPTFRTKYMRIKSPVLLLLNTWLLSEKSRHGGRVCWPAAEVGLLLLKPACCATNGVICNGWQMCAGSSNTSHLVSARLMQAYDVD